VTAEKAYQVQTVTGEERIGKTGKIWVNLRAENRKGGAKKHPRNHQGQPNFPSSTQQKLSERLKGEKDLCC